MRGLFLSAIAAGLFLNGCLYVAPIEEEPEPEDTMPFINAVSPSLGVVEMDLSYGDAKTFVLSTYGDDNQEQPLYHRIIMDFRPSGLTSDAIIASVPIINEPGLRDSISYQFDPCSLSSAYSTVFESGKTIDLYFLLADEPFIHDNELFMSTDYALPFKTYTDRGAIFVQWTIRFKGNCPAH
ncbi:MAG: hypothetical protein IJM59_07865 [Proteobacteria bacterium]|nr:hypothetical protein [Pseudomonadota bacterium]